MTLTEFQDRLAEIRRAEADEVLKRIRSAKNYYEMFVEDYPEPSEELDEIRWLADHFSEF